MIKNLHRQADSVEKIMNIGSFLHFEGDIQNA